MAKGGLSTDPTTRERQLAALAAGRATARARREAGLPWKSRQSPASTSVIPGNYEPERGRARGGAASRIDGDSGERPAPRRQSSRRQPEGPPEIAGFWRFYARVLGYID